MFRDYSLLQARIDELHRDAHGVPVRPFMTLDRLDRDRRPGRVSAGVAIAARWISRKAIDIANRLDPRPAEPDGLRPPRTVSSR
jgi:hypothetical protein